MEYKVADAGLPKKIIFDNTGFVRPHTAFSTGAHIVSIDRGDNSVTMKTESEVAAATLSDTRVDGCFIRSITAPKSS